jgi:uncharacterized membrane protein
MTITNPYAFLLLLLIPVIAYIGWPRNRFRRLRDSSSLFLRALIIILLVLALASIQVVQSADKLAVIFLVDVSDSMNPETQEQAIEYIRETLDTMKHKDMVGVVAFGADAQVSHSLSVMRELGPIRVTPNSGNTNFETAIRLGLAMFPGDVARRMVILSDGLPTIGDSRAAAQLAAAAEVEVSYVTYEHQLSSEIQVSNVIVPAVLDENQEFDLLVTLASEKDTRAIVTVFVAGNIVSRQEVDLHSGVNNYTLHLLSGSPGFREFRVKVDPLEDDGHYQNNSLSAFSRVEGAPHILVISNPEQPEEARYFVQALRENGLQVEQIAPSHLPSDVMGMAQYQSVVLVNIPADDLSNRKMEIINDYVSDLGGGLVVIGGPKTYGPGGYFQTPLEEALPVTMRLEEEERFPQLTIAYLIDRSASMGHPSADGFTTNIGLAKEAIILSIGLLQPTDRVGIASFDSRGYWVAQFQEVSNKIELQRLVGTLRPGGSTSIFTGMELAGYGIRDEPSEIKHIILLTDGGSPSDGLYNYTRNLNRSFGVTTSVMSIGVTNPDFLERMAEAGDGNFYNITDVSTIPTILGQETVLASRTYIQEGSFDLRVTGNGSDHLIMQGIESPPLLVGYVAVEARQAAQVILRETGQYEDPIMTVWQYGLGRSVAFTGDANSRWAQNWLTWDEFAAFWSQTVRWTITEGINNNLETQVQMEDEQARIIVDARDNEGGFLNGLSLRTNITYSSEQSTQIIRLQQIAPGRYEGTFTPEKEGAYLLLVSNEGDTPQDANVLDLTQLSGWVMSYSSEYDIRDTDETLLESIAELTGGRDLSVLQNEVFNHDLAAQDTSTPISPWFILLAMMILPFDITIRRLLITRGDIRQLLEWLFVRHRENDEEGTTERMSSLKQARDRVSHRAAKGDEEDEIAQATGTISSLLGRKQSTEAEQSIEPPQEDILKPSYIQPKELPGSEQKLQTPKTGYSNIGARLLRKRQQDEEEEKD